MKIQNPGSAEGACMTPLKINVIEKSKVTMLPAVCASGNAAMQRWANVEA